jgi:NADH dehydrogenase [ubiquinone] 1 alpha subcomplex assembly factor 1
MRVKSGWSPACEICIEGKRGGESLTMTMPLMLKKTLLVLPAFAILMIACVEGKEEGRLNGSDISKMKEFFNFTGSAAEPDWVAVNDGVMGGRSAGGAKIEGGVLRFSGVLSLENNGGFASVRTPRGTFDLGGAEAMVLRVKGDGRIYQLRISTNARFRESPVSYGAEFSTEAAEWIEVRVPFNKLAPSWRGRALDGPPLDLGNVEEIGLLIGDKRPGPFSLDVDWMRLE